MLWMSAFHQSRQSLFQHGSITHTQTEGQVSAGSPTLAQRGNDPPHWIIFTEIHTHRHTHTHRAIQEQQGVQGETHFQHMISYDAFGLDEDLMDHRVTMVTVHFMDAVLVVLAERQQHLQGQSLGLLAVAQLHSLDTGKGKSPL